MATYNIDVEDLANPNLAQNPSWNSFVREYFEIVRRHQVSAMHLFDYLDARSRVQPKIMLDAYSKIFHEIVRRSGDVFTSPLKLTIRSKMSLWVKSNYMKLRVRMAID